MDKLLEKIPAKYANIANVAIVAASIFVGYLVIEGGYNKVRAESDSYIKNYGEAKTAESRYNSLKENHDKYKDSPCQRRPGRRCSVYTKYCKKFESE